MSKAKGTPKGGTVWTPEDIVEVTATFSTATIESKPRNGEPKLKALAKKLGRSEDAIIAQWWLQFRMRHPDYPALRRNRHGGENGGGRNLRKQTSRIPIKEFTAPVHDAVDGLILEALNGLDLQTKFAVLEEFTNGIHRAQNHRAIKAFLKEMRDNGIYQRS